MQLYTVLSYNPIFNACDLSPAGQSAKGILRDVPIACFWGGTSESQQSHYPRFPPEAIAPAPRWGVVYPVQPGDFAQVDFLGGDQSSAVITGFICNWRGTRGPAYLAQEIGEPIKNRYDVLLPSGAWLKSLEDGSWIIAAAPAKSPACSITLKADGSVVINAPGGVHITNDAESTINGKGIVVIGGMDDDNEANGPDRMVSTGQ